MALEQWEVRNQYITACIYLKNARDSIAEIIENGLDDPGPIDMINNIQQQIDNLDDYIAKYCPYEISKQEDRK